MAEDNKSDSKINVLVPPRYIEDAYVDWEGEIFSFFSLPIDYGKIELNPPSVGLFTLLELCDCDYFHPLKGRTEIGEMIAVYLLFHGSKCLKDVRKYSKSARKKYIEENGIYSVSWEEEHLHEFERKVIEFYANNCSEVTEDEKHELKLLFVNSIAGYSLIPKKGEKISNFSGANMIHDAFFLGTIIASCSKEFNLPYQELLWNVPLCTISFVSAARAELNGVEGINRPKDTDDAREQFKMARERVQKGLLHPWQEKEPLLYKKLIGHENEDEAYRFAELYHEALDNLKVAKEVEEPKEPKEGE